MPATMSDVRIEDPAYRDVDDGPWHSGRFAERVRREWNPITAKTIDDAGDDLEKLADAVLERVGGDKEEVLERLKAFRRAERDATRPPREDPLVRPGAPV